ncbi:hypothetical protein K502DRAFT_368219 [Neoconidiobolus thromboides FSU 785]|nr:hypothetical protein K502DRAFT_368219 [Neoconidiobolus thromboides FSU 785]
MGQNILAVEIIGDVLGVISILLNLIVAITVLLLRKESNLLLGLSFILLTVSCDIMLPIVGITQEAITLISYNPMRDTIGCQILGVFHNVLPISSSCGVMLLSLERYLIIKNLRVPKIILWTTAATIIGGTLTLAIISAINHQFEYTTSLMICMSSPIGGIASRSLYYFMIIVLFTNTLIILYCYYGILNIRNEAKALTNMSLDFNDDSIKFISLGEGRNSKDYKLKAIIESVKQGFKMEKELILKAVLFVACYGLFILPCIILMTYHSVMSNINNDFILNGVLSSIMFASLSSLSLINPILLLLLHNKVYNKFKFLLVSLFRWFQRK